MAPRPNLLLILADDLGYSDIEPFGGEIPTPNLAQLAAAGTRFANFHTAMKCNPTRAMLLTGLDNNAAAFGPRANYQIRPEVPTLAERLRDAGYRTYMAGKWDAGSDPGERPFERGFQRSFALLPGTGLHFPAPDGGDLREDGTTRGYSADGQALRLPEDFHSTEFYTRKIIEFIDSDPRDGQPFFAYASYTAPHYPLQAPPAYIERFRGWYERGYRAVQSRRIARLQELGLLAPDAAPWAIPGLPDWSALSPEERAYEAKRMQVYAAMIAALDDAVGQLLDHLAQRGLERDTLVLFASDNGADGSSRGAGYRNTHDNRTANLGSPSSYVTLGMNWAQVASAPYRLVKAFPTEGGTRAPLIARWPGAIPEGRISLDWLRIDDLALALLELAGVASDAAPSLAAGRSAWPTLAGRGPLYEAGDARIHTYIERRLGGASVLRGPWKLVWWKERGRYRQPLLFNLAADPAETQDLAAAQPAVAEDLAACWRDYAQRVGGDLSEAKPPLPATPQPGGEAGAKG